MFTAFLKWLLFILEALLTSFFYTPTKRSQGNAKHRSSQIFDYALLGFFG
jgi:hypothetical protein